MATDEKKERKTSRAELMAEHHALRKSDPVFGGFWDLLDEWSAERDKLAQRIIQERGYVLGGYWDEYKEIGDRYRAKINKFLTDNGVKLIGKKDENGD